MSAHASRLTPDRPRTTSCGQFIANAGVSVTCGLQSTADSGSDPVALLPRLPTVYLDPEPAVPAASLAPQRGSGSRAPRDAERFWSKVEERSAKPPVPHDAEQPCPGPAGIWECVHPKGLGHGGDHMREDR
jgi:hypothetical protein